MKYWRIIKQIAALLLALAFMQGCRMQQQITFHAQLVKPPVATRQLDPAVFVPGYVIRKLRLTEGDPVQLGYRKRTLQVRIYDIWRRGNVFALHKNFADSLGLRPGQTYAIRLRALRAGETSLTPRPVRVWVENYHGQREHWRKVALGAPHGDCDMKTGDVVKLASQLFGIPATAGYGARLSYRGIWFDMNRPLMKLPKKDGGVFRERVWNRQAEQVYQMYQDSVWQNNGLHYGERFRLFTSFHGHDLTVRLKNGKVIQRPVIEAMGIGFSKDDLRKIKRFYEEHKNEYYDDPPMLVFGNLPEDRVYYYQGIPLTFFYSGLGTRVYGSLRSDLLEYGLHMETPNSMRLDPEVQPKTARFLHDMYRYVIDEILTKEHRKSWQELKHRFNKPLRPALIAISGGTFLMGAPDGVGWASERPQHRVKVKPFEIDAFEVTNAQYVEFLNEALSDSALIAISGLVKSTAHPDQIWCRTRQAAPMSDLLFDGHRFSVRPGRENFPVIFVSWYGAQAYARAHGKRLPTEAEWEMAASWDIRRQKKYLYAYASDKVESNKANFQDSGDPYEEYRGAQTVPVNFYHSASPAGVHGMSGNVMEWCADYYDYGFYRKAPQGVWENPLCTEEKTMRTVRGGAWNLEPWIGRTTFRLGINPNATLVNVGFRCAKE